MDEKTVLRVAHRKGYTVITNALAQDRTLTWEARGVMLYLLSKPDDWKLTPPDLEQECGRDKVYKILGELIKHRYICRDDIRDERGKRITVEYAIFEEPFPEKPDLAKPDLVNTDSTKYREEQSKENLKAATPHKRNLAHDWIVTDVLHASLEQAEHDKTLHSLASKLLTSVLVAERMKRNLPPGAPLNFDLQGEIASHLPGLKMFWQKQHANLNADTDFPSTPPAFAKVVGQWYAAGCPNGAKAERNPLAPPPLMYDPNCPNHCDHGFISTPLGTAYCECQKRIVTAMGGRLE